MTKVSRQVLAAVQDALEEYVSEIEASNLAELSKKMYLLHARNFVRRLDDDFEPGAKERKDLKLRRSVYKNLTAKQQEVYNFQKVAGILAEYGFNCIKLDDDWQGADFLAYRKDVDQTLKVQLKSRLSINKKYKGKDIYMCFPIKRKETWTWYLVLHDELLKRVRKHTEWLDSQSWCKGAYSSGYPSKELQDGLVEFRLIEWPYRSND